MTDTRMAVHTTATPEQVDHIARLGSRAPEHSTDGDCFYGWGERCEWERGCIKHTVLYGLPLREAQWWARELTDRGHQAVVTTHDDWSIVITGSDTPIYYRAKHAH